LEIALEEQQSREPAPSGLSDYELQRLANIARHRQVLQGTPSLAANGKDK
jgi:hypothetical protein